MVAFRDRNIVSELFEKYPQAEIVLTIHKEKDDKFRWEDIKRWNILSKGKLVLCLQSLEDVENCKQNNISYYWGYPINTYYDLQTLKDLGVCYIRLDAPLFFEMDEVKRFGIPVRAVPNVAHLNEIPNKNGVYGTWIRPEDTPLYEDYIEVLQFEDCDLKKEAVLYQVYAQQKQWIGPLSLLITNLSCKADNSLILQEATKMRLNCGQKCQKTGRCHICERALRLADNEKLKSYLDNMTKGE